MDRQQENLVRRAHRFQPHPAFDYIKEAENEQYYSLLQVPTSSKATAPYPRADSRLRRATTIGLKAQKIKLRHRFL
jgi:hypothetical protein